MATSLQINTNKPLQVTLALTRTGVQYRDAGSLAWKPLLTTGVLVPQAGDARLESNARPIQCDPGWVA